MENNFYKRCILIKKNDLIGMENSVTRAKAGSCGVGLWDSDSIHLPRIASVMGGHIGEVIGVNV